MKTKLFSILTLLLCVCSGAWATVLVDEDFTTWDPVAKTAFKKGDNVVNGLHFYCKTDKDFEINATNGLVFPAKISSAGYYVGIPLTGIKGSITITFIHTYNSATAIYRYALKDGDTEMNGPGDTGTQIKDAAKTDTQCSVTINVTNENAYLYIGADGTTYLNLKGIKVTTPSLTELSASTFYSLYASTEKTAAELIEAAAFPSYITTNCTDIDNNNKCSSTVTTPHNFSALDNSTTYYRLKQNKNTFVVEGLSHVKSIRLYGNGNGGPRTVTTTVTKNSGTGTAMTVDDMSMSNSKTVVAEYTTGDLTVLDGYDADTYYTYTITSTGACDIWGIYVEKAETVGAYTITKGAAANGSITVASSADENDKVSIFATPDDGYEFTSWNIFKTGDESTTITPAAASASTTFTMPAYDVTVSATFTALPTYTVRYDLNGGTGTTPTESDKTAGSTITLASASGITPPTGKAFTGWLCSVDGETYAAGASYTMTAAATTFTAQYARAAQKIIYSLTGGIGSAEVTVATATVNAGESLVLTDNNGRIKLTTVGEEQFKNGDAISFSGTIGNTSKNYGVNYGPTSSVGTTISVEGTTNPLKVSGVLSLASASSDLYLKRADATTTTLTSLVISRTLLVSSEAFNGVKINGVDGVEDTDYSVSGTTITLEGTFASAPTVQLVNRITFEDSSTSDELVDVTLNRSGDVFTGTATIGATAYTVNAAVDTTPLLTAENVEIAAETTAGSISFTLDNEVAGGVISAAKKTSADWLTLGAVGDNAVPFTTTANDGAERTATVTLTYTYNTDQTITTDVTITQAVRKYAITEGTHANGAITIDKTIAEVGETITLTATADFRYQFSSWNVTKTDDAETTVTVTDNQFEMPAYPVTVNAIFNADPRKQVLYLTSDGNVNANDKLYAALGEDYAVTKAAYNATSITVTDFDLVVFHESIGGTNYNAGLVGSAIAADVPVLNTKSYFYNNGRLGWGTPNAGTSVSGATLNPAYGNTASHPIFDDVTISDAGFVTLFSAEKAKAMQPVTDLASGKEGYTLAITPNASSGNGVAIHELTPAQRGVAHAKYLMISIGNENGCFEILTANGQKLLKNAAAYLIDNTVSWTPTTSVSGTITASGWNTFSSYAALDLSTISGGTAYVAKSAADGKVVMTECTNKVAAGTGLMIKGTANAEFSINTTADATTAPEANLLVGLPNGGEAPVGSYVFGWPSEDATAYGFYYVDSAAAALGAGKAYLNAGGSVGARLSFIFDDEETTGITDNKRETITNNGEYFNLAGQKVAQPQKGLYIVNGRKVVVK